MKIQNTKLSSLTESQRTLAMALIALGGLLITLTFYLFFTPEPEICTRSIKVAEIISVESKGYTTIKLENGKSERIYRTSLKKGDNYCLAYK